MSINKIFLLVLILLPNFAFPMKDFKHVAIKNVEILVEPFTTFESNKDLNDTLSHAYPVDRKSFLHLLIEAHKQALRYEPGPFKELIEKIQTNQISIGDLEIKEKKESSLISDTVNVTAKDLWYRLLPYIWWTKDKKNNGHFREYTVLINYKLAILTNTYQPFPDKRWRLILKDFSDSREISSIPLEQCEKEIADLLKQKAKL